MKWYEKLLHQAKLELISPHFHSTCTTYTNIWKNSTIQKINQLNKIRDGKNVWILKANFGLIKLLRNLIVLSKQSGVLKSIIKEGRSTTVLYWCCRNVKPGIPWPTSIIQLYLIESIVVNLEKEPDGIYFILMLFKLKNLIFQ